MAAGEEGEDAVRKPRLVPSTRFTLALVCFAGSMVTYMLRTALSMAIVCMVIDQSNGTSLDGAKSRCAPPADETLLDAAVVVTEAPKRVMGEFLWDKGTQGSVLSAFFWGYLFSQVLGGYLATNFGGKRVILFTVLGATVCTLMSPVAARTSVYILMVLRAVIGFFQGAIFPAMHTMWSGWAPPMESSVLTSVSYAGTQIGNVVVLPLSGWLCEHGPDGGWPSIFYVLGLIGLIWCALWQYLSADRPANHPRISEAERDYIQKSVEASMGKASAKPPATPWLSILTSRAVWACWLGHIAGDWGAYTMLVSMPSFLKDVLGLDLSSLGVVSAIPYLAYFAMINAGGIVSDFVRSRGLLSTLNMRRAAMLIALGGQALFLIASGYCGCGQDALVILLLTVGMALSGLQFSGFVVNYLDIAPPFSGTIMGIGNTFSCMGGILSPMVTSFIVQKGTQEEWQSVLWVTGGILAGGAILFALLAKGEVQPWAKADQPAETEMQALNLEDKLKE